VLQPRRQQSKTCLFYGVNYRWPVSRQHPPWLPVILGSPEVSVWRLIGQRPSDSVWHLFGTYAERSSEREGTWPYWQSEAVTPHTIPLSGHDFYTPPDCADHCGLRSLSWEYFLYTLSTIQINKKEGQIHSWCAEFRFRMTSVCCLGICNVL
jgi:hypothetical protein